LELLRCGLADNRKNGAEFSKHWKNQKYQLSIPMRMYAKQIQQKVLGFDPIFLSALRDFA